MPDVHLEILGQDQRALWDFFQREPATIRQHAFVLAGGTALALQLGHRESHDFDFFSARPGIAPIRAWIDALPDATIRHVDADTLHADIHTVKVSFIGRYRYPLLNPLVALGNLVLADVEDIALMKLIALTHRAAVRDYIDLAAILRSHCSLAALIDKARLKYGPTFNPLLALRTLAHFDDLDGDIPTLLDPTLVGTWQDTLRQAVKTVA